MMLKHFLRGTTIVMFVTALFSLLLVSCADMFQPKIPFGNNNDTPSSLEDLFFRQNEEEIIKLLPPEQLYIAPFYSDTRIRLTWTAVRDAAYYMVERAVALPTPGSNPPSWADPDSGDYEPLERFVYGTSFTDEILRNPALDSPEYQNRYFYRITAFNTARRFEESVPSVPQSAMLFRAPENVRASGGTSIDFVELRWDHTAGAELYEIWRSDLPNGAAATLLGTVWGNQNWYRNNVSAAEQGRDFFYMIIAVNRFNNRTLRTRPAYGYARIFGAPDAPANVLLQSGSGRGHSRNEIRITWDAVSEMNVSYAVFRNSSVDSSLTRLSEGTPNTTWTDSMGLRPGIYYYYRIQAVVEEVGSGRILRSQFSSPDPEGFVLSSPDAVVAERSAAGDVTVRWMPALGNENERSLYTYNVYADTRIDGSFSTLVTEGVLPVTDAQGFISAEVPAGGHTFFRVSTVNVVGGAAIESDKSMVVSPAPSAAVIEGATRHALIQNASANSSGVFPVRITWRKPETDTPAFYHIERSVQSGGDFSRINDAALPADGPFTSDYSYDEATGIYTFTDRNEQARVGRKFHYRVLSLNQLEQGNFPSDERIGWGALTHEQYIREFNRTMSSALRKLTLMHRPGNTDKLGSETRNGTISGTIFYNAQISGIGARIIIQLTNYADFYIEGNPDNGVYFTLNGNSNTSANMSSNGTMDGTVTCTGMYPGRIFYDRIEIRGGAAGGGTYGVEPEGFPRVELPHTIIN